MYIKAPRPGSRRFRTGRFGFDGLDGTLAYSDAAPRESELSWRSGALYGLEFGATRLPQIGRGLGEGIRNFRRGVKDSGSREQLEEGDEAKDRAAS